MNWSLILLAIFVAAVAVLIWIVWTGLVINYRPKI